MQDIRRPNEEAKLLETEKQMDPDDPELMPAGADHGSDNRHSGTSKQVPRKTEFDFRDYSNNDNNNYDDDLIYSDDDDDNDDDSYNSGYEN